MNPPRYLLPRFVATLLSAQLAFVFLSAQASAQIGPLKVRPPEPFVGTVVDTDGKPVPDAEVFLVGMDRRAPMVHYVAGSRTRSDAHGEFEIALTPDSASTSLMGTPTLGWLIAQHSDFSLGSVTIGGLTRMQGGGRWRIVLRPRRQSSFRIVGTSGDPIAGAGVRITAIGPPHRSVGGPSSPLVSELSDRFRTVTNSAGDAVLDGVGPDQITGLEIVAQGFGIQTVSFRTDAEGKGTISLRPVGRLTVRVVADDPAAVRGVVVRATTFSLDSGDSGVGIGGRFEGTTDQEGRIVVSELAEGTSGLSVRVPADGQFLFVDRPNSRKVVAGRSREAEVRLERGVKVFGVVREKGSGRPIAGAMLSLVPLPVSGFHQVLPRTDPEGLYSTFVLPGKQSVRLANASPYRLPAGAELPTTTVPKDAKSWEIPPIELIHGRDLEGLVVGEDGRFVADCVVQAQWTDRGSSEPRVDKSAAKSNRSGEFVLRDLPNDVDVWLTASFGEARSAQPLEVPAGDINPLILIVSRENTQSLGGRVVDERGKLIAGAEVWVSTRMPMLEGSDFAAALGLPSGSVDSRLVTDAEGRFQTPRTLSRYEEMSVWASAPGRVRTANGWFAPTTPSFFEIVLQPTAPADQQAIRKAVSAGQRARDAGNLVEAEKQFRAAVEEADRRHIADPIALAGWLDDLGAILNSAGKNLEADPIARRSLALRQKALDPGHPDIASSYSLLAYILDQQQRYDDAERFHRSAIAIREKAQGEMHPQFAHQLYLFGWHLLARGESARAETELRRALPIQEKVFGPDSLDTAWTILGIAQCATALRKYDEDERLYKRVLQLFEKRNGAEHRYVAEVLEAYAWRLRKTDREAEAEPLEARAKAIRAKLGAPAQP